MFRKITNTFKHLVDGMRPHRDENFSVFHEDKRFANLCFNERALKRHGAYLLFLSSENDK